MDWEHRLQHRRHAGLDYREYSLGLGELLLFERKDGIFQRQPYERLLGRGGPDMSVASGRVSVVYPDVEWHQTHLLLERTGNEWADSTTRLAIDDLHAPISSAINQNWMLIGHADERVSIWQRAPSGWTDTQQELGAEGARFGNDIVMDDNVAVVSSEPSRNQGRLSFYQHGAEGWLKRLDVDLDRSVASVALSSDHLAVLLYDGRVVVLNLTYA